MVHLITSDNHHIITDNDVLERSVLITTILKEMGEKEEPIDLPEVSSRVLWKILEYCEHHRGEPVPSIEIGQRRRIPVSEWDQRFITLNQDMLFEIINGADYLDMKSLIDDSAQTVNMIKANAVRKLMDIVNDITPEKEAQIKEENRRRIEERNRELDEM